MKRTRRQETSIIVYFSFYTFLILWLLSYFIFSLVPSIKSIEWQKDNTQAMYEELQVVNEKWLDFQKFKEISKTSKLNDYVEELIKSVQPAFYKQYFENTTNAAYSTFLENQSKSVTTWENYDQYLSLSQKVSKVLPVYSEVELSENQEFLSDFKFIHYIESIISTFNLEYNNEIWISELLLVEEFSNTQQQSKLDTNIYYIPVELNLEWLKTDIINFLYFVEHVGNTSLDGEKIVVENQNSDLFLYRGNNKIILDGERVLSRTNYNIFENQFIDIQEVNFDEYIDEERTRINKSEDLISRINKSQWNDKYSVQVTLRFYVKGVQNIKMMNQLQAYVQYFQNSLNVFKNLKKNTPSGDAKMVFIDDGIQILWEMSKDLKNINIALNSQTELIETMKNTNEYKQVLHKLHSKVWYQNYILNVLSTYNKMKIKPKLSETNPELYNYIASIDDTLSGIKKLESETQEQYENRLNNRDTFLQVLKIEQNLLSKNK